MIFEETYTLQNRVKIPKFALGTWLLDDGQAKEAVKEALNMGYRHVDTAQAYGNEVGVGQGIQASDVKREDVFVTSKVAAEHKDYESTKQSIEETLNKLGLDTIDMMIIHSPQPWVEVNQSENRYFQGNKEAWRALEDAYKAGKIRAIGVSNFQKEDIENILEDCEIKPMVNQILAHVSNTPLDLIEYCQSQGIQVEAYSPIGHGEVLKNEEIKKMADKYNVSVPQLCLRYDLQLGLVVLPKTGNPDHMRSNAEVDFTIEDSDMEILKNIETIKDYGDSSFFPVFGGKL